MADSKGSASRLYPDLGDLRDTDYMKDAIDQTGAVLMGQRTFDMGDPDSFVGNKVVQVVGGPSVIHELLDLGLVDELRVDVMPVMLGDGLRLFDDLDPSRARLQKQLVQEVGARTSLGFRVITG